MNQTTAAAMAFHRRDTVRTNDDNRRVNMQRGVVRILSVLVHRLLKSRGVGCVHHGASARAVVVNDLAQTDDGIGPDELESSRR
jgi:hypothetical protein